MTVTDRPPSGRPTRGPLDEARRRLHARFDETCGAAEVEHAVAVAAGRLAGAPVQPLVPLLVERAAGAHLTARSWRSGTPPDREGE